VNATAAAVSLRAAGMDRQAARTLSGGNQQKLVLGKWLLTEPSIVLLDEPTRGIDVGAKHEVYRVVERLAAGGAALLVISSELEELLGLCDRILVMAAGRLTAEFPRERFDRERILAAALRAPAAAAGGA
jgi:ribose transport system ATP-binding protein